MSKLDIGVGDEFPLNETQPHRRGGTATDATHRHAIKGASGRHHAPRTWRRRLATLLIVAGLVA